MSSSFRLLAPDTLDLSQAVKNIIVCYFIMQKKSNGARAGFFGFLFYGSQPLALKLSYKNYQMKTFLYSKCSKKIFSPIE